MIFRKAEPCEGEAVLALWRSLVGRGYCPWGEEYPGRLEMTHDLETDNLFVMIDGDEVIGALSVVPENELDDEPAFRIRSGAREIARVAVAEDRQGQGIAYRMVSSVSSYLKAAGTQAIHLSVEKNNFPARQVYERAGFLIVGETDLYGLHFFLCEKIL